MHKRTHTYAEKMALSYLCLLKLHAAAGYGKISRKRDSKTKISQTEQKYDLKKK